MQVKFSGFHTCTLTCPAPRVGGGDARSHQKLKHTLPPVLTPPSQASLQPRLGWGGAGCAELLKGEFADVRDAWSSCMCRASSKRICSRMTRTSSDPVSPGAQRCAENQEFWCERAVTVEQEGNAQLEPMCQTRSERVQRTNCCRNCETPVGGPVWGGASLHFSRAL